LKKVEAAALDIDGTFMTSDGRMPDRVSELLRKAYDKGVSIIFALTRNYHMMRDLASSLGIADPLICTNGAQVLEGPDGLLWTNHVIGLEVARRIAKTANENGWEMSTTVGMATSLKRRPGQEIGLLRDHVYIRASNQDGVSGEPIRILFWQLEAIEAIRSLCESEYSGEYRTETYYKPNGEIHSLGVFAAQADKGTALSFVLDRLTLNRENVVAIGDNENGVCQDNSLTHKLIMLYVDEVRFIRVYE
jgi:HAD superfamily hydrolase (TIGR01484 family)